MPDDIKGLLDAVSADNPRAVIGDNRAPMPTPDELLAELTTEQKDLVARRDELLASVATVPAVIADD